MCFISLGSNWEKGGEKDNIYRQHYDFYDAAYLRLQLATGKNRLENLEAAQYTSALEYAINIYRAKYERPPLGHLIFNWFHLFPLSIWARS